MPPLSPISPISVLGLLVVVGLGLLVFTLVNRARRGSSLHLEPTEVVIEKRPLWFVAGILVAGVLFTIVTDWWPQWWPSPAYQAQFNPTNPPVAPPPSPEAAPDANPPSPPPSIQSGSAQSKLPAPAVATTSPTGETTLTGVVRAFSYGPGGEVDGLVLDQNLVTHFPPDQSGRVSPIAPVGTRVRVRGWAHTGPAGDRVVDAETITNRETGASISTAGPPMAGFPPAPPLYGAGPG